MSGIWQHGIRLACAAFAVSMLFTGVRVSAGSDTVWQTNTEGYLEPVYADLYFPGGEPVAYTEPDPGSEPYWSFTARDRVLRARATEDPEWYVVYFQHGSHKADRVYIRAADVAVLGSPEYGQTAVCETDDLEDSHAQVADVILSVLPDSMLQEFRGGGWSMVVTDRDLSEYIEDTDTYTDVKGLTIADEQVIYLEDDLSSLAYAPVHEFGHWFDVTHGDPSQTVMFHMMYGEEGEAFMDAFDVEFYYDICEFFADGFRRYYVSPVELQVSCPQLYEYLDELLRECA